MSATCLRVMTVFILAISLALCAYSAYLTKIYYDDKHSTATRAVDSFTGLFNTRVTTKLNIKLANTGAVAIGAGLQFLSGILVLICAGKNSSKFFIFIESLVFILLGAVIGCYLSSGIDYEGDQQVQFFLGGCVADLILLTISCCVTGSFIRG